MIHRNILECARTQIPLDKVNALYGKPVATHQRRCLTFTAQRLNNLHTPPDMRKNDFFSVPPAREHRFSAQQKQRKSIRIRGQGERTSGRRVAEPQKNRQKRTELHRKRTVFLQKRTVFRSNGQAFTKFTREGSLRFSEGMNLALLK